MNILEFAKFKINQSPIFKTFDLVDENFKTQCIVANLTDSQIKECNTLYGINLLTMVNNQLLTECINSIQKDAMRFYLNNFKEKDYYTIDEYIEKIENGIMIVNPAVGIDLCRNEKFIDYSTNHSTNFDPYLIGVYKNTKIVINPHFSWSDRRFILLTDKILVNIIDIEGEKEIPNDETCIKQSFKIKYSIRYPESILGYSKEENK